MMTFWDYIRFRFDEWFIGTGITLIVLSLVLLFLFVKEWWDNR
jgi:hypothetical protein